jgi:proteic killer suppression protein
VIQSFAGKSTAHFWNTGKSQGMPPANLRKVAARKLQMLDAATDIKDLEVPPGNRLEELTKERVGRHSIRINEKFRVCFRWHAGNAYEVEICDYHS